MDILEYFPNELIVSLSINEIKKLGNRSNR